jgi:hypothetical protein
VLHPPRKNFHSPAFNITHQPYSKHFNYFENFIRFKTKAKTVDTKLFANLSGSTDSKAIVLCLTINNPEQNYSFKNYFISKYFNYFIGFRPILKNLIFYTKVKKNCF